MVLHQRNGARIVALHTLRRDAGEEKLQHIRMGPRCVATVSDAPRLCPVLPWMKLRPVVDNVGLETQKVVVPCRSRHSRCHKSSEDGHEGNCSQATADRSDNLNWSFHGLIVRKRPGVRGLLAHCGSVGCSCGTGRYARRATGMPERDVVVPKIERSRSARSGALPWVTVKNDTGDQSALGNPEAKAPSRDSVAERADLRAETSDRAADLRDVAADSLEAGARPADLAEIVASAKSDRADAAVDRERASNDRADSAADRKLSARQRSAAEVDELTGAHRRGPGLRELKREVARARRSDETFVVAYVDVDGLKAVNDTHGHAAGDRLLRELVRVLRARFRVYDLIVRVGGDEFCCAFPRQTMPHVSARFSEVSDQLARLPEPVSISVGVAELGSGETSTDLIRRADAELYRNRTSRRSSDTAPMVN